MAFETSSPATSNGMVAVPVIGSLCGRPQHRRIIHGLLLRARAAAISPASSGNILNAKRGAQ
jgi:hypothetical protein